VDAVFYPVALNAIPKKKKPKSAKKSRPATKPRVQNDRLKGGKEIASFLGQPVAVSQRWARSDTPVTREGGSWMPLGADSAETSVAKLVWTSLFILQPRTWICPPI
jgi:hypothetical protein